jgi:hypothetical protein
MNRIRPAWMLYENIYAVRRNEAKFRSRNRAKRARFEFGVFREDIVALMRETIRALGAPARIQQVYAERDIPGLGKCVLTESDRIRAVDAYRFYVRHASLLALKLRVCEARARRESTAELLQTPDLGNAAWEFHRRVLAEDFAIVRVEVGLALLADSAFEIAKVCERTRGKDDARGARIIDDYAEVHPSADQDLVVKAAWDEAEHVREEIETLCGEGRAQIQHDSPALDDSGVGFAPSFSSV